LIPEAERSILAAAKKQLFEKGYAELAIREVASQCGIAVGTIYNYFPGKEMLVAAIMAEDWRKAMARVRESFMHAESILVGVMTMYDAIKAFSKLYAPTWSQYDAAPIGFGERHLMLRGQLSNLLCELIGRHGRADDAALCPLLAETVLACAMHQDLDPSALSTAVSRLFL
jgi:AcrR family transcriptional regulator